MLKQLRLFVADPVKRLIWSKRIAIAIFLTLGALSLFVVLSIATLNYVVVPHIADWRESLEGLASNALKAQVKIGSVSADTTRLIPSFEILNLTITSPNSSSSEPHSKSAIRNDAASTPPDQMQSLRVPRLSIGLSVASLMRFSFEKVEIDRPVIALQREVDGQIRVIGLPLVKDSDGAGLDWFFSQPSITVHNASATWLDHQTDGARLEFFGVELSILNGLKTHRFKLEGTPGSALGARFSLVGNFKETLLSTRAGDLQAWSGTLQAVLPNIDILAAKPYLPTNRFIDLKSGNGWLSLVADIRRGKMAQLTADFNFPELFGLLIQSEQPLNLKKLSGRVVMNLDSMHQEFKTQNLHFTTQDQLDWEVGAADLAWSAQPMKEQESTVPAEEQQNSLLHAGSGSINLEKVELKPVLTQIDLIPLSAALKDHLKKIEIKGLLKELRFNWDFDGKTVTNYKAQGELKRFSFDRTQVADDVFLKGIPSLQNSDIKFKFNKDSGSASLSIDQGSLTLTRWLENPLIELNHASADLSWSQDEHIFNFNIANALIENADAKGNFSLTWNSPRIGSTSTSESDLRTKVLSTSLVRATKSQANLGDHVTQPFIDLQINVSRADASQIYRYLPNKIDARVRKYLQDAIKAGELNSGSMVLKGPVNKFPFVQPSDGDFKITAKAQDLTFQYLPANVLESIHVSSNKPWPEFVHMRADVVLDRKSFFIKNASSKVNLPFASNLEWFNSSAEIQDILKPEISLNLKGKGPLAEMLRVINSSAIGSVLDESLANAQVIGSSGAEYSLKLNVPLNDWSLTKVMGSVAFANNEISLSPLFPTLSRLRGVLSFTETSFTLTGLQARILGSDTKFDGALRWGAERTENKASVKNGLNSSSKNEPKPELKTDFKTDNPGIKIQGSINADGLKQNRDFPALAKLASALSGQTPFNASLSLKKGQLEFIATSNLVGLLSQLPPPFSKSTDYALPLRSVIQIGSDKVIPSSAATLSTGLNRKSVRTQISLGQVALMSWLNERVGTVPFAPSAQSNERAWIGISAQGGIELPQNIEPGISMNIELPKLDLDTWERLLGGSMSALGAPVAMDDSSEGRGVSRGSEVPRTAKQTPLNIKIKTDELTYSNRSVHQVLLDASFQHAQPTGQWHMNISSAEASGAIDYRLATANLNARLFARMSLLNIPPTAVDSVESLLSEKETVLPALDLVVDDLQIKGKKLGHAEMEASNQPLGDGGKEWRIQKLTLAVPEAKFQATGTWALIKDSKSQRNTKKTKLDFNLDVENAGLLLDRMGTKGALSGGHGKLSGQISWIGSPLQMDYATMGGQFNMNIEKGSFLKTEPGAGRLLGVLNLQALPRRLLLDFKDIFSEGFAFDFLRGDIAVDTGVAKTNNLQMKSVNAAVLMEGSTDIGKETQTLKVIVIPEIDAGTASLVVAAINPVVGISSYLAQYFLKKPISQATTKDFLVEGTWSDPKVTKADFKKDMKANPKP